MFRGGKVLQFARISAGLNTTPFRCIVTYYTFFTIFTRAAFGERVIMGWIKSNGNRVLTHPKSFSTPRLCHPERCGIPPPCRNALRGDSHNHVRCAFDVGKSTQVDFYHCGKWFICACFSTAHGCGFLD